MTVWTTLADSLIDSADSGSLVCVDHKLYAMSSRPDHMYVYDIATDAWSQLPVADGQPYFTNPGGVAVGTTIWFVDETNWAFVSYDTVANSWGPLNYFDSVLTDYPNSFDLQFKPSLVEVGGVLYTYGTRWTDSSTEGCLLSFAVAGGDQSLSQPSTHETFDRTLVADSTRVFAVEGYEGQWDTEGIQPPTQRDTGVMETYTVGDDMWSFSRQTDPQFRNDHVAVITPAGKIYVIGGGSDDNLFPDGYAVPWISSYNTITDEWAIEGDLDQARSEPMAAVDPTTGILYVWGGQGNINDPSASLVSTPLYVPGPPPLPPNPDLRVFVYDRPNAAYLPVT